MTKLRKAWPFTVWWNGIWNESYMNCGYEIKWSYDLRSYERNFCNCVEKPENFRTSTPEFFRLLYAIAKIAFITAKIIASLHLQCVSIFLFTGAAAKPWCLRAHLHNRKHKSPWRGRPRNCVETESQFLARNHHFVKRGIEKQHWMQNGFSTCIYNYM